MNPEWKEFLDSTVVTVGGEEKRVGDCTPEEIEALQDKAARELQEAEEELAGLRYLRDALKVHPPGTALQDLGFVEKRDGRTWIRKPQHQAE